MDTASKIKQAVLNKVSQFKQNLQATPQFKAVQKLASTPLSAPVQRFVNTGNTGQFLQKANRLIESPSTFANITPLSMRGYAAPSFQGLGQELGNLTGIKQLGKVGETAGNIARGALTLTPFQSPKNIPLVGGMLGGQKLQDFEKAYAPASPSQKFAQDLGQGAMGIALTAPYTGLTTAGKLAGALGKGAALNLGFSIAGSLIEKGKLPTLSEAGSALTSSVKNAWVLPVTGKFTDVLLKGVAPKLVGKAITDPYARGQIVEGTKRVFLRALAEVIPENTAYTFLDQLGDQDKDEFLATWASNLPGAVLGNLISASAQSGGQIIFNQNARNALKNSFNKAIRPWMIKVTTNELDKNGRRISMPMWQYKLQNQPFGASTKNINELPEAEAKAIRQKTSQLKNLGLTPSGIKERGFSKTVQASELTVPKTKETFKKQYYEPITNKGTISQADQIIKTNLDEAINIAKNGESSALNNAVSMRLVEKFQNEGNYNQASDLLETLSKKPTSQGQAIQILSYWSRLSPTGSVKYAQQLADRAAQASGKQAKVISPEKVKQITEIAKTVQSMPDGRAKTVKTAELMDSISSVVEPSLLRKISSLQTMAQLLNPKTAIRNVLGNFGFQVGENVSRLASLPLDVATSVITGKRSITAPNISAQVGGLKAGFKEGLEDALKGVDTSKTGTQFDLGGKTFRDPILGTLEKIMNIELKAPDRAFYRAAFDESLQNQIRLNQINKTDVPMEQMIELAHKDGLYRTFQDESAVSRMFSGLKKALNLNREFGLGDVVLKYPKTPGNLIQRGIDYSPAGFINTVSKMADPLFGRQFDQKSFVESFGRAITGTAGLITTGAILNKLGIITGKPEKDKDISATQRAMGMGQYKINVSALKRFVTTGFSPDSAKPQQGDTLVSYDWVQPFAIGISMGANISENNGKVNKGSLVDTLLGSLQSGIETLAEQPLVKGVRQIFQGYSPVEAFVDTVKGIPASFVPSIVSQTNQATDNVSRETYSPSVVEESINLAKARIPGLSQTLPKRYTVFGEEMQRYQDGSNSLFNVFLNPAFVTKLDETPGGKEVIDIYERSGETQQAPRLVSKSVTINGQKIKLNGEQISQYQQYVGERTKEIFDNLAQDKRFMSLDDASKSKILANVLTDINNAAKVELFGNTTKGISKGTVSILSDRPKVQSVSLADGTVVSTDSSSTGSTDNYLIQSEIQRLQSSGEVGSKVGNTYLLVNDSGSVSKINIDTPISKPSSTGVYELDKKLRSSYNSKIESRIGNVAKLVDAGLLDAEAATKIVSDLRQSKIYSSKTRKVGKAKIKKIRMPKVKKARLAKIKISKPKLAKIKPIKLKAIKTKPIKLAKLKTVKLRA